MQLPRLYHRLPSDERKVKGFITRGLYDKEEKAIYINPKQGAKQKLITIIHEMLHFLFPKRTEAWVEYRSILMGEMVWRMGFRLRNENTYRNTRTRVNTSNPKRKCRTFL